MTTASSSTQKFVEHIAFGCVNGQIEKLITTVNKALAQRPSLACVFITGNFFAAENPANESVNDAIASDILNQAPFKFPIPTYFIAGNVDLPKVFMDRIAAQQDGKVIELVHNLFFCGKAGYHYTDSGFRFAYISGHHNPSTTTTNQDNINVTEYHPDVIKAFDTISTEHIPMDLLISYEAPLRMVTTTEPCTQLTTAQSPVITDIVQLLRPRYHIVGGPKCYYARRPYKLPIPDSAGDLFNFTRFISLGQFPQPRTSKKGGDKWSYAFAHTPFLLKTELDPVPPNASNSPFSEEDSDASQTSHLKRDRPDSLDVENKHHHTSERRNQHQKLKKDHPRPVVPVTSCWFCLNCEQADRDAVFHVGTHVYGAIAKGGLVPGHLLYVSRKHVQHWHRISENTAEIKAMHLSAMSELATVQKFTTDMFTTKDLLTVSWQVMEMRPNGQMHAHMQMVPVPGFPDHVEYMRQATSAPQDTIATGAISALLDRFKVAFEEQGAEFNLRVCKYVVPNAYVGSLTRAMYHVLQVKPVHKYSALSRRHMAIMVCNQLLVAELRGRSLVSIPRQAVVAALGMDPAKGDWRLTENADEEHLQASKMSRAFVCAGKASELTGVQALDSRLGVSRPMDMDEDGAQFPPSESVTYFHSSMDAPNGWAHDTLCLGMDAQIQSDLSMLFKGDVAEPDAAELSGSLISAGNVCNAKDPLSDQPLKGMGDV